MSFYEIAESPLLYALVIIGILYVVGLAFLFLARSWKRASVIGITKDDLKNVVKSTISFTIVPSIAIVIGFFSIAAMLGIPWPWFRLSVVGSVTYELMTSNVALQTVGADLASADGSVFTLIMYVMSICILGGLLSSIFISKKIVDGAANMKDKDARWGSLGTSCFMLSIIVVFLVPMLLTGGVTLLTWLTSFFTTVVLGIIMKKYNLNWLQNFILAFSLLIAMVSSVLWTNILG